ncbi:unnamed protein product [Microthlaspi erraticum]|uniref:F-box associated beta-propeller type 3 domain-containing protein n=1 Tax=Microthlaspi erraticum TaxID=1685480 RepID=A0A6D2J7X5_9BRAS|nr:unnamed protein product [Microthlaspi erraticum]
MPWWGWGTHTMVALRGLVLCTASCGDMCIYNPTTRQTLILPRTGTDLAPQEASREYGSYLFGHDPVLDQYKVVYAFVICSEDYEMIATEYSVLVLEAGGYWREMEHHEPPPHHLPTRVGLCINGVIYYLAVTCMTHCILVSFDVGTEEFKKMELPYSLSTIDGPQGVKDRHMGFIEYGGKPAILDHNRLVPKGLVDLWVLEDGGRWSKKPLALQPCQMHLVDNDVAFMGTSFQLAEMVKFNMTPNHVCSFYITLLAHEAADNTSLKTFQVRADEEKYGQLNMTCSIARLKGEVTTHKPFMPHFHCGARVDGIFKGEMPDWPSDDDAFNDEKRFYVVEQRTDVMSKLEIVRVAIETGTEDVEPPNERLKAKSARALRRVFEIGKHVERKAIVRRVMDDSGYLTLKGTLCGGQSTDTRTSQKRRRFRICESSNVDTLRRDKKKKGRCKCDSDNKLSESATNS